MFPNTLSKGHFSVSLLILSHSFSLPEISNLYLFLQKLCFFTIISINVLVCQSWSSRYIIMPFLKYIFSEIKQEKELVWLFF